MTSLTAFCGAALGAPSGAGLLWATFCATIALYNLDEAIDAKSRRLSRVRRFVHLALTGAASIGLVAASSSLSRSAVALLTVGFVTCAGYALPLGSRPALKGVPGLKAPFVGFAVAGAVVLLPYLDAGGKLDEGVCAMLFVSLGLCCTVNALSFDAADVDEDERQGIPSLPRLIGVPGTRRVSLQLLVLSGIVLSIPVGVPGGAFAARLGIGCLVLALFFGSRLVGEQTRKSVVALGIDGALLLPWAVLTLAS